MSNSSVPSRGETSTSRPELHVTAELGVLEAPAGVIVANGDLHVFHQFRPRADEGSRWAHQVASDVPYDWDVSDDVLTPQGEELDVLAGSSILLSADPLLSSRDDSAEYGEHAVELFFVTSTPRSDDVPREELLGNKIHHGLRGQRSFQIQRAFIPDVTELHDVSDDPSEADARVERLGPIEVDCSSYPVDDLVTPNVFWHGDSWLMIALALRGEADAEVVALRSSDRQNWKLLGPLKVEGEAGFPAGRPFAPRMVSLKDESTEQDRDVLFVTYPSSGDGEKRESTGYVVGELNGTTFNVSTPYTVLDFGHDFTRPRVISDDKPILFGLVGSHPDVNNLWANCLSSPRYLSLVDGHVFQDIVGAPRAVKSYSDRALIWTGQLDCCDGLVTVDVLDKDDNSIATIKHDCETITVSRNGDDSVSADLRDTSSATLTVFVDGPVVEVIVDGGAITLTSSIPAGDTVDSVKAEVSGGAIIINSMVTVGQEMVRARLGLDDPEEQERFMQEALEADREVAAAHDAEQN